MLCFHLHAGRSRFLHRHSQMNARSTPAWTVYLRRQLCMARRQKWSYLLATSQMPATSQLPATHLVDPPVSSVTARGATCPDTAEAEPPDDPPLVRAPSYRFMVRPLSVLIVTCARACEQQTPCVRAVSTVRASSVHNVPTTEREREREREIDAHAYHVCADTIMHAHRAWTHTRAQSTQ